MNERHFEYDVGLSFAGEQRAYVRQVADDLKSRDINVFFDEYKRESLWGKNLYDHLSEIYQYKCKYCVIFVSKGYANKVWPNAERRSAQARAVKQKQEYILPARFDATQIPGLLDTVSYIDVSVMSPSRLSALIAGKLGKTSRQQYLPPTLDRLFESLEIEDDQEAQDHVSARAFSFFEALGRMTPDERDAIIALFRYGCPTDLPDNIHIDVDFLRRLTGKSVARLKGLLGGLRSLGFGCSLSKSNKDETDLPGTMLGDAYFFRLRWLDLNVREESPALEQQIPAMLVARRMIDLVAENYCVEHGAEALDRLDFSPLAPAFASSESKS